MSQDKITCVACPGYCNDKGCKYHDSGYDRPD